MARCFAFGPEMGAGNLQEKLGSYGEQKSIFCEKKVLPLKPLERSNVIALGCFFFGPAIY